jgi:Flp pilus assembly pilin Flp
MGFAGLASASYVLSESLNKTASRKEKLVMINAIQQAVAILHKDESGQGLVEYVLLVALIALAAVFGMQTLANKINSAFTQVGTLVGNYVS